MPIRYALYFIGCITFMALFTFSLSIFHQVSLRTDELQYLNKKILAQETFIVRHTSTPRASLDHFTEEAQIAEFFNYSNAPQSLLRQTEFGQINTKHQDLKKMLSTLKTAERAAADNAIILAFNASQKELTKVFDNQFHLIKKDISSFIWICTILLIVGSSSIAIPFTIQRNATLKKARDVNNTLRLKAQELSATHKTMGNMLEDIVHERRQATRTAEINARLAAIINSADDAIFSLNLGGLITTANDATLRIFGDDCVSKRFTQLFPNESAEKLRGIIMATEQQNCGTTIDLNLECQNQRVDLSLTISPIFSERHQMVGFSVIAKDISNTKLEEERFRLAVEAAPNAMIMINNHGYIVLVNTEAEVMFGYTRDELYGQSIHQLVPSNLRSFHAEHLITYLQNPDRRSMGQGVRDLNGQKKDGARFPIEVGLTPIRIDKDTYIISSIVDVSERRLQQLALTKLNNELSRKNQEMEQFIYTVSHDLKAPLVTISGFAERLKSATEVSQNEGLRHKVERILTNVKAMDALLQDLLHLSRVIKRDLEKDWVNTEKIIDNALQSLEITIKKLNADIRVDKPFEKIFAQESLLYQCIQNIISNSLKYRNPDRTPVITITPIKDGSHTGIAISDNGIGIAEQHKKRIFNVFERLHPEICEGTGVGLSIVKTIIEKHNGKIFLESTEGVGSKFTVYFPIKNQEAGNDFE